MDHNTHHFNRPEYIEVPVPPSKGFNPHTNPAFFIYPDGSNMTFWFGQIDDFRRDQLFTNTIFSIQIGAALVILCVMFCVTHADKRKTIVYLLNVSNLFVVIIRGVFFVHYFMGGLARTYTTFTWDTSDVQQSEKVASIVSSICSLILMIGTQISLLLQVRICYALNPRSKTAILVTCGSISGIATTAYLLLGAYTIQLRENPPDMRIMKWAKPVVNALVALSMVSFSGIFSWRMFQSVRNRRRMGFTGIGSLESLLASGFQCLVFPAMFCIIENFVKFGGSASLAQASIAFFLPVSHMWASSVQANSRISMERIEKLERRKEFWERIGKTWSARIRNFSQLGTHIISIIRSLVQRVRSGHHITLTMNGDSNEMPFSLQRIPRDSQSNQESSRTANLLAGSYTTNITGPGGKDLEAGDR